MTFCRMKRDAEYKPQAFAFRPVGNSPSVRHLTPVFLLFYTFFIVFHYANYYNPILRTCQDFPKNYLKKLAISLSVCYNKATLLISF